MQDAVNIREEVENGLVSFAFTAPAMFRMVMAEVRPHEFFDEALRNVYAVLCERSGALEDTSDLKAVIVELRERGLLIPVGGPAFIGKLSTAGYAASNARYYIDQIHRLSKLRTLGAAASELAKGALDEKADPDVLLAVFDQLTQCVAAPKSSSTTLAEAAKKAIELQEQAIEQGGNLGMKTGFMSLDMATGGFFPGQLVLLSGRTYTGKTTLALNMASNMVNNGYKVAVHCLEMKDYELAERFLCADASLDIQQFATSAFTPEDLERARNAVQSYIGKELWLFDSVYETVTSIRGKAKYHKAKHGLDVLFIDHLQRLTKRNPKQERHEQLNEDVRALKDLARELDCAVVLLTQLKVAQDENAEPTDADYAEARQIRQEADIAMMLHRRKNEDSGKLILNKVRKGGVNNIDLVFDGPHQKFQDIYISDFANFS